MTGEKTEFSGLTGAGTVENGEIKSTPATKLPFQIEVEWAEGSTIDEQSEAQGWITAGMSAVNEDPDDMPKCINAVTVRRT